MKKYIFAILSWLIPAICFSADAPRFSLLTCAPGQEIYELEGHTALRIIMPDGEDLVANWGVFDFNTPNFAYRFTKGETDYRLAFQPTGLFLASYARQGRSVEEQNLALSEEEAMSLAELLSENALPENVVYRYNYVYDNCATRPLELIEKAVGTPLVFNATPEAGSFREAMTRYHEKYPWYQFGIDVALGSGIDKKISVKEEAFAPVRLHELMKGATRSDGRKIVSAAHTLVDVKTPDVLPTPWYLHPLTVSLLVMLLTILFCGIGWKKHYYPRIYVSLLFSVFGFAGLLLTFLIFISTHEATFPNWLYLWLNPLPLVIAAILYIKPLKKLLLWLQIINFAAVFVLLIVGLAGIQCLNSAFYPLIISSLLCSFLYLRIFRCQKTTIK